MGDNFLLQHRNYARRRRERSIAVLERPTLYTRPDLIGTAYRVRPVDACRLETGEVLTVYAPTDSRRIDLARGHRRVGYSDGEAAEALWEAVCADHAEGCVRLRITEVSQLSGVAQARLITEEEHDSFRPPAA